MDLGDSLRAARERAGLSLAGLARLTHYSKALLGHLETGRRAASPEHVAAYARALDVPVSALYGEPADPLRVAHEWLVSDSPAVTHSTAGRRVGVALAEQLERRVDDLRHMDDMIGGRDLYPLVRRELGDAATVVRTASYTAATGRRLLTVVGELSQLVGWVASDAGRYLAAEHTYLSGVSAARDAGDDVLAAQLLSSLAYQQANVADPADALLLARSAVAGASSASPLVRALLLERVAWAAARARDHDAARRVLDGVDDAYADRGDVEPPWVYWLDRREIDVMRGRCLIELGRPAEAEPLLASAIDGYAPDRHREVALYGTWLAEAHARSGEMDAARTVIRRARRAAEQVASTRLDERVAAVELLTAV